MGPIQVVAVLTRDIKTTTTTMDIPVAPHEAVAEVSRIGNL